MKLRLKKFSFSHYSFLNIFYGKDKIFRIKPNWQLAPLISWPQSIFDVDISKYLSFNSLNTFQSAEWILLILLFIHNNCKKIKWFNIQQTLEFICNFLRQPHFIIDNCVLPDLHKKYRFVARFCNVYLATLDISWKHGPNTQNHLFF